MVGSYIVVLGHSCRMFGCLGNLVPMGLPRRQWRHAAPRGGESVSLVSGALMSGCREGRGGGGGGGVLGIYIGGGVPWHTKKGGS